MIIHHIQILSAIFAICVAANLSLYAPSVQSNNNASVGIAIEIQGYVYNAKLHANKNLTDKIANFSGVPLVNHYAGKLNEVENSWIRISYIDKLWQGVASLNGTLHIIGNDDITTKSDATSTTSTARTVLKSNPASTYFQQLGSCGTPHDINRAGLFEPPTTQKSSAQNVLPNKKNSLISPTVAFTQLCDNRINGVCLLAEIEFAFDDQFQAAFGSNALAQAHSLINIAEGFYVNDFNIAFDAITIEMLTEAVFSKTTVPIDLLKDIANKKNNELLAFIKNKNALFHLVTGRNLDELTIGIANLKTVCKNRNTVGLSQLMTGFGSNRIPLTAIVVAHELGHNFGANHDGEGGNTACQQDTHIMTPTIDASLNKFSSCSISEIESNITANAIQPANCFNFPIDLSISSDDNNPSTVVRNQSFTSQYLVSVENAYLDIDQIFVEGQFNLNQGQFNAVNANGNSCTINQEGSIYGCEINKPGATIIINVQALTSTTKSVVTMNHSVMTNSTDNFDVLAINNKLTVNFSVHDSEIPIPTEPPPSSPQNSTNTSGGGFITWWNILILAIAIGIRRSTRYFK